MLSCAAAVMLSCTQRDRPPAADSIADTTAVTPASAAFQGEWAGELGRLLLVPSDSENAAVVLFPDAPSARTIAAAPVTLLSASGDTMVARVASVVPDSVECGDAARVRFSASVPPTWTVGLLARSAPSLRMDSIEALPTADSARLAADLARLASTLPMDETSRFSGLPFVVLGARRFEADGREVLAAQVVRRLSQEAAPLEERTLIITERARSPAKREPWVVTYSRRSEGSEDTAEHFEVLAAVRGRASTLLLIARDQLSRTTYELLERTSNGWRVRWSRTLSC